MAADTSALLDKAGRIADPFEQSFFAMAHVPCLQPLVQPTARGPVR